MPFRPQGLRACGVAALAFFLILGTAVSARAQNSEIYPYFTSDKTAVQTLADDCSKSIYNHLAVPKGVNGAYRKSFGVIRERTAMDTYGRISTTALQDTILEPFVQAVFQELKAANPTLPASRIILTRSPVANAYALADGTVFVNIGLLAKLKNEAQLAYVLSHEVAHVRLQHMQAGIQDHLNAVLSKEFKKQLRQVSSEKYNRTEKLAALFESVSLNTLYHKRSRELQADSLGYKYLTSTTYNTADAYTALQLLDTVDDPFILAPLKLEKYFSCSRSSYNFDPKKKAGNSIFDIKEEQPKFANSDSLKTHPDCQKRMASLNLLAPGIAQEAEQEGKPTATMQRINRVARIELIQSWFDFEQYGFALYEALQLLEDDPTDSYARNIVPLCLHQLKRHMQSHTYSELISTGDAQFSESLSAFFESFKRFNTSDFAGFGECFSEAHPTPNDATEYSLAARFALAQLSGNKEQATEARLKYQSEYNGGRFFKLLFAEQAK